MFSQIHPGIRLATIAAGMMLLCPAPEARANCAGVLGDRVWADLNGDGCQDAGEPGVAGIHLQLYRDVFGVFELYAETITDADGYYLFDQICAGTYYILVDGTTVPDGWTETAPGNCGDETTDSDCVDGRMDYAVPFCNSCAYYDLDCGLVPPPDEECTGSIGDFVWYDEDCDGRQDAGEPGVPGVQLDLYRHDDEGMLVFIGSTVTDANGRYAFTGLCAGSYVIKVEPSTVPDGYMETGANLCETDACDSDCVNGQMSVTLGADDSDNPDLDCGIKRIPEGACTRTIGYWKTHPEAWPVEQIEIGGKVYSKSDAIAIMARSTKKDKTYNLFEQLVAAKLNLAVGTDEGCIIDAVLLADIFLMMHPVGSGVSADSDAWQMIAEQFNDLDHYNNGLLCAPHCD